MLFSFGPTWSCCLLAMVAAMASAESRADHQPTIVATEYPAPWIVVEGDWGLYRPDHHVSHFYEVAIPIYEPSSRGYFPKTGKRPRYGRHEVDKRRGLRPVRAESYYREWSTHPSSRLAPVHVPLYPPAVITAPRQQP